MEKTEILALIDKAIKGQGTNVDAGGALATILEAIVEAIPSYVVEIKDAEINSFISEERYEEINGALALYYRGQLYTRIASFTETQHETLMRYLPQNAIPGEIFGLHVEFVDDNSELAGGEGLIPAKYQDNFALSFFEI